MKVYGYDPFISIQSAHELSHKIPVYKDLGQMLGECDYITIHVPVSDNTKGMIDKRRFSEMKDDAVLLNYVRDTLVNEDALLEALENNRNTSVRSAPVGIKVDDTRLVSFILPT